MWRGKATNSPSLLEMCSITSALEPILKECIDKKIESESDLYNDMANIKPHLLTIKREDLTSEGMPLLKDRIDNGDKTLETQV